VLCTFTAHDSLQRCTADQCHSMGFSDGIFMCALIRAFAGIMSSSIRVAMSMCSTTKTVVMDKRADWHAGTMIGDISVSSRVKARNYSRLPLISTGGVIGPLLQAALAHRFATDSTFWQRFPILSSQLACAGLISILFLVNLIFLKEVRLSRIALVVYFGREMNPDGSLRDHSTTVSSAILKRGLSDTST
jgi:MFS family permease